MEVTAVGNLENTLDLTQLDKAYRWAWVGDAASVNSVAMRYQGIQASTQVNYFTRSVLRSTRIMLNSAATQDHLLHLLA